MLISRTLAWAVSTLALGTWFGSSITKHSSYESAEYGFSIDLPQFETDDEVAVAPIATFQAPPQDGFAPNINVQRQRFERELADFVKEGKQQYASLKFEVTSERVFERDGAPAAELTAEGEMQKRRLVVRQLIVKRGDFILLATATVPADRWEELREAFQHSLDSLELDK